MILIKCNLHHLFIYNRNSFNQETKPREIDFIILITLYTLFLTLYICLFLLTLFIVILFLELNSEIFKTLFTNKEFCDLTLNVEGKEFKVHKLILASRSPVFATMFKQEASDKQTGVVNISDFNPDLFEKFLKYSYYGDLDINSFNDAFCWYKIAQKYDIQGLKMLCVEYMLQNLKVENVSDVIEFAKEHDESDLHTVAIFHQHKPE